MFRGLTPEVIDLGQGVFAIGIAFAQAHGGDERDLERLYF